MRVTHFWKCRCFNFIDFGDSRWTDQSCPFKYSIMNKQDKEKMFGEFQPENT